MSRAFHAGAGPGQGCFNFVPLPLLIPMPKHKDHLTSVAYSLGVARFEIAVTADKDKILYTA